MTAKKEILFDPKVVEAEENLLIDYQFLLQERMSQKGISQSALSELAGISKARLSQILSDDANPTVKTFAGLFYALGERVCVSSAPLEAVVSESHETPAPREWQWAQPIRMAEPISEDMVAIMKRSTPANDKGSKASNDNYAPECRVTFVDSEVVGALVLELEPEPEPAAA
jgi:transcriptional regulator with XRE-family HTH domain